MCSATLLVTFMPSTEKVPAGRKVFSPWSNPCQGLGKQVWGHTRLDNLTHFVASASAMHLAGESRANL